MYVYMSVVVTVWGVCWNVCGVAAIIKNSVFFWPWSVEVCCVFV